MRALVKKAAPLFLALFAVSALSGGAGHLAGSLLEARFVAGFF